MLMGKLRHAAPPRLASVVDSGRVSVSKIAGAVFGSGPTMLGRVGVVVVGEGRVQKVVIDLL